MNREEIEKLILDFYNSNTVEKILNERLGLPLDIPVSKDDQKTLDEIALKHIRSFLDELGVI